MNNIDRNNGLDVLKFFLCFLIICIHVPFPGKLGTFVVIFSRIAVPIFFMISGYFYENTSSVERLKRQIYKIVKLCLSSSFVYCILYLLNNDFDAVIELFRNIKVFDILLFNVNPFKDIFWYLNAILYVIIIEYLLLKIHKIELIKKYDCIFCCLLIGNLVFGVYSKNIFARTFEIFITRNFLFCGIPFFIIGKLIRRMTIKFYSIQKCIILCLLLYIVSFVECLFSKGNGDIYLSTIFLSITIFVIFLQFSFKNNKILDLFEYVGNKLSTTIYIIHPLLITFLNMIIPFENKYIRLVVPFIIFIGSILFSYVIINFKRVFYVINKIKGVIV